MNTFKRKALTAAVLAGLGAAGSANAIYQDPNGLGQYLVYPYYTVNSVDGNAYNTYITVVNPTTFTKVVRFRAREGRLSTEVRDFNIYLSPNDVWAAAIIPNGEGAAVVTTDNSCTNPPLPAMGGGLRGVAFTNILYAAGGPEAVAGWGTGLDRLKEGYIEIVELGVVDPLTAIGALTVHNPATDTPDCGAELVGQNPQVTALALPPRGGLNGTGTLIHVPTGLTMGYNAAAFGHFTGSAGFCCTVQGEVPNFGNTSPAVSVTFASSGSLPVIAETTIDYVVSQWAGALGPWRAASATMMHTQIVNEYGLDNATRSNTDWVVTFPTKRGFLTIPSTTAAAAAPFSGKITNTVGACEPIAFTFFNREERSRQAELFSPTLDVGGALCWESTVLSFRNGNTHTPASGSSTSGVLGSRNVTGVDLPSDFQNGWALLTFTGANALTGMVDAGGSTTRTDLNGVTTTTAGAHTYRGLPVLGFMVRTLQNTAVNCGAVGCKFGALFPHKYMQNITQP